MIKDLPHLLCYSDWYSTISIIFMNLIPIFLSSLLVSRLRMYSSIAKAFDIQNPVVGLIIRLMLDSTIFSTVTITGMTLFGFVVETYWATFSSFGRSGTPVDLMVSSHVIFLLDSFDPFL